MLLASYLALRYALIVVPADTYCIGLSNAGHRQSVFQSVRATIGY